MKISVIVSTYNRPDALKRVLDGLLDQTRLPDEVIIADDGSGNDTRELVETYLSRRDIQFRHVWHADKGFRLAEIRNLAIRESNSDYLVFLDGDCIPERHFVADHLALARAGHFFQGKRVIVSETASPSFTMKDVNSVFRLFTHALSSRISNSHHIIRLPFFPAYTTAKLSGVRGCNMGFFKTDLLAVNGFNQSFKGWGREDSEIVVRLYKYGIKRREHPFRAVCYHLWHPENTREKIDQNDELLVQAMNSDTYCCTNGINNE